jgi:2'-5' RNA ligase
MRLFVALNLPDDVRARINTELLEPLRNSTRGVRWVRPEMLHVTLAFHGERSDTEAREASRVVEELAQGRAPLRVTLRGLGAFPSTDRPRVVWLGLDDPSSVRQLHRAFERERARLGVPAEGRAYHPHVTLGRVPGESPTLTEALAPGLPVHDFHAEVTLASVDLMRSETAPSGLHYSVVTAAPFISDPETR